VLFRAFEKKEQVSGGIIYPVSALSDQDGSRHLCPRHSPTAQLNLKLELICE